MSKEKQIEEIAHDLCHWWNGTGCTFGMVGKKAFCKPTPCKFDCNAFIDAERLYNKGYRKQSEGEWKYNPDGMDWGLGAWQCSLCGCRNDNLPMDKNIKPLQWAGTKYCPNCGAKMKGGAE